jgi:hypothetical protein
MPQMEVRMLQITVTLTANQEKAMAEARRLEREGIAKIHEHVPTLILNVPDHRGVPRGLLAVPINKHQILNNSAAI